MSRTLTITKGLPASGKTTWAEDTVRSQPLGAVARVNRDSIRELLHFNVWTGSAACEEQVTIAAYAMLEALMDASVPLIICDDTNLSPRVEKSLRQCAERHGYGFVVKDFTYVPVDLCIERDARRERTVGAGVIRKMAQTYMDSL